MYSLFSKSSYFNTILFPYFSLHVSVPIGPYLVCSYWSLLGLFLLVPDWSVANSPCLFCSYWSLLVLLLIVPAFSVPTGPYLFCSYWSLFLIMLFQSLFFPLWLVFQHFLGCAPSYLSWLHVLLLPHPILDCAPAPSHPY